MGAAESYPTNQEEERKQESGGGSMGRLKTAAVASIAVVGVAALAISKMPRRSYKMNTDGSCRPNQSPNGYVRITPDDPVMKGPSGFGGILRDDRGKWVRGFLGFIKTSDCLTVEIYGIHKGLLLLDELGLEGSVLESDSEAATNWIIGESDNTHSQVIKDCWDIIKECRQLVRKNNIRINCCSRDANKCADKLASMAVEKRKRYVEIMDVPNELKRMIDDESLMMC